MDSLVSEFCVDKGDQYLRVLLSAEFEELEHVGLERRLSEEEVGTWVKRVLQPVFEGHTDSLFPAEVKLLCSTVAKLEQGAMGILYAADVIFHVFIGEAIRCPHRHGLLPKEPQEIQAKNFSLLSRVVQLVVHQALGHAHARFAPHPEDASNEETAVQMAQSEVVRSAIEGVLLESSVKEYVAKVLRSSPEIADSQRRRKKLLISDCLSCTLEGHNTRQLLTLHNMLECQAAALMSAAFLGDTQCESHVADDGKVVQEQAVAAESKLFSSLRSENAALQKRLKSMQATVDELGGQLTQEYTKKQGLEQLLLEKEDQINQLQRSLHLLDPSYVPPPPMHYWREGPPREVFGCPLDTFSVANVE